MPIDFAKIQQAFQVHPGKKFRLADHDPGWAGDGGIPEKERKEIRNCIQEERGYFAYLAKK